MIQHSIYINFQLLLQDMKLQEKEAQKNWSMQEICLERTYS